MPPSRSDKFLETAWAMRAKGRPAAAAIAYFEKKVPDLGDLSPDSLARYARLLLEAGRADDALEHAAFVLEDPAAAEAGVEVRGWVEEYLPRFSDPVPALDACWNHHARSGDWDGARAFLRSALPTVPRAAGGFRSLLEDRVRILAAAPLAHAAFAHVALAEKRGRDAVQHLRAALAGPRDLAAHAADVLEGLARVNPDRLDIRWALLEAGRLNDQDWIAKAMEAAAQDPKRMVEYLRDAAGRPSPQGLSRLRDLAKELTERFPSLPAAWEVRGDLEVEDPDAETAARLRVVRLEPGLASARAALARIHELADQAPGNLRLQFSRIGALLLMTDFDEARTELEPLVRVDPEESLRVIAETRSAGVEPPDEYLVLEASCLHRLGRDVEAAGKIRAARGVPPSVRAQALAEMRVESPASPDLACALAEVCAESGEAERARRILLRLLDHSRASARAILDWLDGPASRGIGDAVVLRTRAELTVGDRAAALGRIAALLDAGEASGRELLPEAARRQISAPPDFELDLEVLRMLSVTGIDSDLGLRFLGKLRSQGDANRVLDAVGRRVPDHVENEEDWLRALAGLHLDLGKTDEVVATARAASTVERSLAAIDDLLDEVPEEERWLVQEGKAELLLEAGAAPEVVLEVLASLLRKHPSRTGAVLELLRACPQTEDTRAEHLLLRGRCEEGLSRPDHAAETYLLAARAASAAGQEPLVVECADRLRTLVDRNPRGTVARLCLSRVGALMANAEAALSPIRDAPEHDASLFDRLDEVWAEFPGEFDALWTSVEWHRQAGSHGEALTRLAKLLESSSESADRVRRVAEEIHEAGGGAPALLLVADVDRKLGRSSDEFQTLLALADREPGSRGEVVERLRSLHEREPGDAECLGLAIRIARETGDAEGLIEIGELSLRAPLDAAGAVHVAERFGEAARLEVLAADPRYWTLRLDHAVRARRGDEAVAAARRLLDLPDVESGEVERRLRAMQGDGILPASGVDLLIEIHEAEAEGDRLAAAIRSRWTLDADESLLRRLRASAERGATAAGSTPDLRSVLGDLCIALGDPGGALENFLANTEHDGIERTLERLGSLEGRFPDEPRIPLDRAVRILGPRGRAREAALDVELVLDMEPGAALDRGLPCLRELLSEHGGDPELRRVLARLEIHNANGEAALDHLNHLAAAGSDYRDRTLDLFSRLADRCPDLLEARIRCAEVLAESARAAGDTPGAATVWALCEGRCREVLGLAPGREDRLRAVELCAASLAARSRFEDASEFLADIREQAPEEPAVERWYRENRLLWLAHLARTEASGRERAVAHLRSGRTRDALAVLEGAEEDEAEVAAVRAWAHYAAGNHDRVVTECEPFVGELPASGRLERPLPDLVYFLGRSCLRTGDEARGIRLLERLAADHPCHRACRAFLEEHYRRRDAGEARPIEITAGLEEVRHGKA